MGGGPSPAHMVGLKQSRKAVREGTAETAYVAADAEPHLTEPFCELCQAQGVPVVKAESMQKLGEDAGIEVGCAFMVKLKPR